MNSARRLSVFWQKHPESIIPFEMASRAVNIHDYTRKFGLLE